MPGWGSSKAGASAPTSSKRSRSNWRRRAMRKIFGGVFLSLDGVMQGPGGQREDPTGGFDYCGWMVPLDDDEIGKKVGEFFDRPYDLLLGRRTHEIFAGYWPYATGEGAAMGEAF